MGLVSDEARLGAKESDSRGKARHLISAEETLREADLASQVAMPTATRCH